MKLFKNDFDKLYEELSLLNEASTSISFELSDILDNDLRALFNNSATGLSIHFDNIVKLSNIIPDYSTNIANTDLFKCWSLIKYIISTKHNRDGQDDDKKYWVDRLCNAFYKPYLTEKGILDTINTHNILKKLNLIYSTSEQEHFCLYEGKGQDIPDFKSQSTGFFFECKPHDGDSNPHRDAENKTFIIRYSTNYNAGKGVFYLESYPKVFENFKQSNEKLFSAAEWQFIENIWINSFYAKRRLSTNVPYEISEVALDIDKMDHPCRDLFKKLDGNITPAEPKESSKETEVSLVKYIKNKETLTASELESICSTLEKYKTVYLDIKNLGSTRYGAAVTNYYVKSDNFYETDITEIDNPWLKEFWELVNKKASLAADLSNVDLDNFKKDLDASIKNTKNFQSNSTPKKTKKKK